MYLVHGARSDERSDGDDVDEMGETLGLFQRHESEACVCRICFATDEDEELISPCWCKGGSEFVHDSCLQQWRAHLMKKPNMQWKAYTCTVCRAPYSEKVTSYGIIEKRKRRKPSFGCLGVVFGVYWRRVAPDAEATHDTTATATAHDTEVAPTRPNTPGVRTPQATHAQQPVFAS
ncbi:hypothetical protein M885DRAFT_27495 [Pelagophyceae sp. CCMP2097]|nr:hypothetical protein M885DRAFT_27495 [Pelagophyceae sp. CCMP2097]|mmetsp:Transcript_5629/g.20008  ORF Transcript_5629/g.20008 Transcript_5629/m.20008 type:complete len:176 (-) Transcript_5629:79-606(-)